MSSRLYCQPTTVEISQRLRSVRISRGLSLHDVEIASQGKIKAATLGSYERSDRSLTLERALEIAAHYEIPLGFLLGESSGDKSSVNENVLTFDLRKLRLSSQMLEREEELVQFLSHIIRKRSDWNGEILTTRSGDVPTLAILLQIPETEVVGWLRTRGLLFAQV